MAMSVIDNMHTPTKLFKLVNNGQALISEICSIYRIKYHIKSNNLKIVEKLCDKRFPNANGVLLIDKFILLIEELDNSYILRLNEILK